MPLILAVLVRTGFFKNDAPYAPLTLKGIWERLLGRIFENDDQNLCMLANPRIAKQVASMRKEFKTESWSQSQ